MNILTIRLIASLVLVYGGIAYLCVHNEAIAPYFSSVWTTGGRIRSYLWNKVIDAFGEDSTSIFVGASIFVTTVWYWALAGIFTALDFLQIGKKYKIQPGKNEPPDYEHCKQAFCQILYNQTVIGIPVIYMGGLLIRYRDPPPVRQLPPFHWVLLEFGAYIITIEVVYYYLHRLFHEKHLYRAFHGRHHEWTSPIAMMAFYCHPVEHAVMNMGAFFLVPFIFNSHVSNYVIWFALAVLGLLNDHSGYHLPFVASPEFHDFHHVSFVNNFGVIGLMDGYHGTDALFKKSIAGARHFVITSFESAREIVPDDIFDFMRTGKRL